ncbi:MAG: GNAT family protein [Parvularculaceae bacterium]
MFFTVAPANPVFTPTLVHEPALLRPAVAADYPEWLSLRQASRAHLTRWEDDWRDDQVNRLSFLRRIRANARETRRGAGLSLLVFNHGTGAGGAGEMVGGASLTNIRFGASRSALIGYWIGEPFIRRGFGRAALGALVAHGFGPLDLNRLVAACQPENIASQKLLESNGFAREGLAREYLKINGVWRDHFIYALTASEHARRTPKG